MWSVEPNKPAQMGANVRRDPSAESGVLVVTDPDTRQDYWCVIRDAWAKAVEGESYAHVMGDLRTATAKAPMWYSANESRS